MNIKIILIRSFALILIICLPGCLKDDSLNLAFHSFEPKEIGDGILLSSPENENVDRSSLEKVYNDVFTDSNLWSLRSLLVYRHGKLISEAYLKDPTDITNRHFIWSCTKQVVGVLTGVAIKEGLINDISDPISLYLEQELTNHPEKNNITIENLLTMQSGINYGNGEETDQLLRKIPDNSVELILQLPINNAPGTVFHYNDGNPHLISAIIQNASGMPADQWAEENLFNKLNFTNYEWIRYRDEISFGGFGIKTTPRELSKITLCVADKGKWQGEQVVDSLWIEKMTSPLVQTQNPDYSFGYFWWVYKDGDIPFMWGVGGQFAFIIPHKNLVIVMTSYPNTKGEYEIQANEALAIVDQIIATAN